MARARRNRAAASGDRPWLVACHGSAAVGLLFPFGHVVAPFVVWWLGRRRSRRVAAAGRAAVNFQLTMTVLFALAWLLRWLWGPARWLPLAVVVADAAVVVVAVVETARSRSFHYPWKLAFLSS